MLSDLACVCYGFFFALKNMLGLLTFEVCAGEGVAAQAHPGDVPQPPVRHRRPQAPQHRGPHRPAGTHSSQLLWGIDVLVLLTPFLLVDWVS